MRHRSRRVLPSRSQGRDGRTLSDAFVLLGLATLPFTQALTIDAGFPLKVAELAFAIALPLRVVDARRHPISTDRRLMFWAKAFLWGTTLSLFYAVTIRRDRPRDFGIYRIDAEVDGWLQLAYMLLALAAFWMVKDLAGRRWRTTVAAWLLGAGASVMYALYMNLDKVLGVTPPLLPGTSTQVASVGGLIISRAGTFLEGNLFGMYLLTSLIIALVTQKVISGAIMTTGIIISLSTLNIAFAIAIWVAFLAARAGRAKISPQTLLVSTVLLSVIVTLPTSYYHATFVEKLQVAQSQSAIERKGTALAAVEMFGDHPVLGVGLAQYGLYLPRYRPSFVPDEFLSDRRARYIPNNVYAQIAAEQGLVGLAPFTAFLALLLRTLWLARMRFLAFGVLGVLGSLNAFPSASSVFLWAFLGVAAGLASKHKTSHSPNLQTPSECGERDQVTTRW